jgi:hypothetical protein
MKPFTRTHHEWLVINRDGSNDLPKPSETPGWTALCLAHEPFLKLMDDHTREFVSRDELDGAWFDMSEPIGPECFCSECQRHIRAQGPWLMATTSANTEDTPVRREM